jgi:hypothetical protein
MHFSWFLPLLIVAIGISHVMADTSSELVLIEEKLPSFISNNTLTTKCEEAKDCIKLAATSEKLRAMLLCVHPQFTGSDECCLHSLTGPTVDELSAIFSLMLSTLNSLDNRSLPNLSRTFVNLITGLIYSVVDPAAFSLMGTSQAEKKPVATTSEALHLLQALSLIKLFKELESTLDTLDHSRPFVFLVNVFTGQLTETVVSSLKTILMSPFLLTMPLPTYSIILERIRACIDAIPWYHKKIKESSGLMTLYDGIGANVGSDVGGSGIERFEFPTNYEYFRTKVNNACRKHSVDSKFFEGILNPLCMVTKIFPLLPYHPEEDFFKLYFRLMTYVVHLVIYYLEYVPLFPKWSETLYDPNHLKDDNNVSAGQDVPKPLKLFGPFVLDALQTASSVVNGKIYAEDNRVNGKNDDEDNRVGGTNDDEDNRQVKRHVPIQINDTYLLSTIECLLAPFIIMRDNHPNLKNENRSFFFFYLAPMYDLLSRCINTWPESLSSEATIPGRLSALLKNIEPKPQ